MIYLVGEMSNGSAKLEDTYPRGIGRCYVERPLEPFTDEPWILDNGVFRAWNAAGRDSSIEYNYAAFEKRLPRAAELAREGRGPMFVVVPDRPGDAASVWTSLAWIADFELENQEALDPMGWAYGASAAAVPLYLAVQDGMDPAELRDMVDPETGRPWLERVSGIFLGGTDSFKADTLEAWAELARDLGLGLHYGRCTQSRIATAADAGCDSADSSHPNRLGGDRWARFLDVYDSTLGGTDNDNPDTNNPGRAPGAPDIRVGPLRGGVCSSGNAPRPADNSEMARRVPDSSPAARVAPGSTAVPVAAARDLEIDPTLCPYCGGELEVDVLEVWGREFQLETCCEDLHEEILDAMNDGELDAVAELVGQYMPVRQLYSDGNWQIDFGLEVREISRTEAREFVRDHHRHNPPPAGDRFRFGAFNGPDLIAVAMVGRPVARMIDHTTTVEVNRLCVNHEQPAELTWKACSALYRAAALEAERRGFSSIITYTLESESGRSLRYARWKPDGYTRGGSWNRPSRPRVQKSPTCRKRRWRRRLNPREDVAA